MTAGSPRSLVPLMWAEGIAAEAERLRALGVHPTRAWEQAAGVQPERIEYPARERMLIVLRETPGQTVAELAAGLGITTAAVANLLREMATAGIVLRVGSRPRARPETGGQPSVLWAAKGTP